MSDASQLSSVLSLLSGLSYADLSVVYGTTQSLMLRGTAGFGRGRNRGRGRQPKAGDRPKPASAGKGSIARTVINSPERTALKQSQKALRAWAKVNGVPGGLASIQDHCDLRAHDGCVVQPYEEYKTARQNWFRSQGRIHTEAAPSGTPSGPEGDGPASICEAGQASTCEASSSSYAGSNRRGSTAVAEGPDAARKRSRKATKDSAKTAESTVAVASCDQSL